MKNPLPAQELREILAGKGFLRLYGQDSFVYVSDVARRVSAGELKSIMETMRERGFSLQISHAGLLLIDLLPERWEALFRSFQPVEPAPFPTVDLQIDVYALARLLGRHPSPFSRQPMELVRAMLKRFHGASGLPALARGMLGQCAQRLRRGEPLPSALADGLTVWLADQPWEVRT